MNNPKVDNVFRSKLENYQVKPPVDAWASIEKDLTKGKNNNVPLYKIAASLILISVSTLIAYNFLNKTEGNININEQIVREEPVSSENKSGETANLPDKETAQSNIAVAESEMTETKELFKDLKLLKPLSYQSKGITSSATVLRQVAVVKTPVAIPPFEEERLPAVTISYRPGEKMLNDDATSEPAKESTLRKAWDYALSVKNGEERPFNIKEMKNELFASNFKRKRSKTQD